MWTPEIFTIIIFTFVLAGFVKGVTGLGLPTVALALLAAFLGLGPAIVLMLVPSLVTNIWQALAGGAFVEILRRQWPMLITGSIVTVGFSVFAASVNTSYLLMLLGVVLCLYSGISLFTPQIALSAKTENWLSPVVGLMTGALTGLTGTFVVPSVPYFQALGLSPRLLVQTMGVWFTIATLSLGLGLTGTGLLSGDLVQLSMIAIIPALSGMWLGQRVRNRLPAKKFRKVFFTTLFALGLYIALKAIVS